MVKPLPSDRGDETFSVLLERMLDRQRAEDREYFNARFQKLEVMLQKIIDDNDTQARRIQITAGPPRDKGT